MAPLTPQRKDRYHVGDMVTFIDFDPYIGGAVQQEHWRKHGKGPYTVEAVDDFVTASHGQLVYINGERYSGWYFNPVRAGD